MMVLGEEKRREEKVHHPFGVPHWRHPGKSASFCPAMKGRAEGFEALRCAGAGGHGDKRRRGERMEEGKKVLKVKSGSLQS